MSKKLIIGSRCLEYWFPDFNRNYKGDLDILTDSSNNLEKERDGYKIEWHKIPYLLEISKENLYLEPNLLYTLKLSHTIGWDIHWSKNLYDIQFMRRRGCEVNLELFYKLYNYWNTVHIKNYRSNLNQSANEFFDNALKCEYSHDWLHTLLNSIPTYLKVLADGEEVDICQNKFDKLSHEEKYALVFEEVAIMEFERNFHKNYKIGYSRMLKKFIISHAKLFEALWILENYIELEIPKFNYRELIMNKIKENELQKA